MILLYVNLESKKQCKEELVCLVKATAGVQKCSIGEEFYDVIDTFVCHRRLR